MIKPVKIIEYNIYSLELYNARTFLFEHDITPGGSEVLHLQLPFPFIRIINFKIHTGSDSYDVLVKSADEPDTDIESVLLYKDIDTYTLFDNDLNAFVLHNKMELCPTTFNKYQQCNDRDLYLTLENNGTTNTGNVFVQLVYQVVSTDKSAFREVVVK